MPQQINSPGYFTRSLAHPCTLRSSTGPVKLNSSDRKAAPVVYLNSPTGGSDLDRRIAEANARFRTLMRSGNKAAAFAASREASRLEAEKLRRLGIR